MTFRNSNLCGSSFAGYLPPLKSDIAPTFVSLRLMRPEDILDIHLFRMDHTLFNLCLSYPVSWAVSFSAHIICFIIFYRAWRDRTTEKHRLSRIVLNASR